MNDLWVEDISNSWDEYFHHDVYVPTSYFFEWTTEDVIMGSAVVL